ncbi:MAG: AraC family ligand binding domain-containing protein, partial [Spirochaetales bacterium]|nr:AraC family ligand binding domain-containing protein [Spirochaetales bacterium]
MSISINQIEPLMPGFEDLTPMVSWLSPYVRQCGNAPRGRWKMDSRRLLDYLLVYIEKGEGFFRIGSEGYRVKPGDLFWIPPGTVHYMEGTGDTMVCPYVHFDLIYRYPESHWEFSIPSGMTDLSDFAGLAHPTLPDSEFSALSGRISIRNHHRIGEKINGICRESALAPRGHTLSLSGMMMELLAEILKDSGREESTDRYAPVMEASAAYIRSNLETALPVAELAEMHNL